MIYTTTSPKETQKIASELILKLEDRSAKHATVIALEGELGAGKTVFVQGISRALNIKSRVKSPTFVLMKKYDLGDKEKWDSLYHFDCYRLRDERDLEVLGIGDIIKNPGNIVLIEWAERVKKILPKKHIKIHIDHMSDKQRRIIISR